MIPHNFRHLSIVNSVPVVAIENKLSPNILLSLQFGVGSAHDTFHGIAHFIEHLLLRGNKQYDVNSLKKLHSTFPVNLFGYTSREFTRYQSILSPQTIKRDIPLTLSLLTQPLFLFKTINREYDIIEKERVDSNLNSLQKFLQEKHEELFGKNSHLGHDILGSNQSIHNISLQHLYTFYYNHYNINNLSISITSPSFKYTDDILQLITSHLKTNKSLFSQKINGLNFIKGSRIMKYPCCVTTSTPYIITSKGSYQKRLIGDVIAYELSKNQTINHIPYSYIDCICSQQPINKKMISVTNNSIQEYVNLARTTLKNDYFSLHDYYSKFVFINIINIIVNCYIQ